jgi:uncharacterized protein (DUF427 family)
MLGHTITTEPAGRRLVARAADGRVLAESDRALLLHETGSPIRTYFPPEDVRFDDLTRSARSTHCPFKGDASYWSVAGLGDVAWSYEDPKPERSDIRGLIAFWDGRGVEVEPSPLSSRT